MKLALSTLLVISLSTTCFIDNNSIDDSVLVKKSKALLAIGSKQVPPTLLAIGSKQVPPALLA
ncbi:MAG: hypothetical protein V7733_07955, partial [Paraglaciecola polaris]